jgi:formiminotetrahydrofolate cyclodeaminase
LEPVAAAGFSTQSFADLLERIAAKTATPGGGTAAALAGAMGAALGVMAVRFSAGRKSSTPEQDAVLATVEAGLVRADQALRALADEDAAGDERVREARKLPKGTPQEVRTRSDAIAAANVLAVEVPWRTARVCRDALELLEGASAALNPSLATDAGSGGAFLQAAARAACWNVLVNLVGDRSADAASRRADVERLRERLQTVERRLQAWVDAALTP